MNKNNDFENWKKWEQNNENLNSRRENITDAAAEKLARNLLTSVWLVLTPDLLSKLKEKIIIDIENKPPLTRWSEGEIFKVRIELEWIQDEFLIAKKKRWSDRKHEFHNHQFIYDITRNKYKDREWVEVKVPVPLFDFLEWQNEFLVMEHINWKTLYTIIWEKIVNKHLMKFLQNLPNDASIIPQIQNLKESYSNENIFDSNFWDYLFQRDISENEIRFNNDTEAEDFVENLLWFLNEHTNFDSSMDEVFKKNMYQIELFTKEEKDSLASWIKDFLSQMHEFWFYHRDLWWNPRNIMIWNDGKVYIIDFWKSAIVRGTTAENIYQDMYWKYDRDEAVLEAYINPMSQKESNTNIEEESAESTLLSSLDEDGLNQILEYFWIDSLDKNVMTTYKENYYWVLRNFLAEKIVWESKKFPESCLYYRPKEHQKQYDQNWRKFLVSLLLNLPKDQIKDLKDQVEKDLVENKKSKKFVYEMFNDLLSKLEEVTGEKITEE